MFFLKKLFQAREKVAESRSKWDDVEKPFLDHLEDLRKMLMKMVLTLGIAMTLCFVFDKELLEIVRYPVKMAGLDSLDGSRLPDGIKEADWGKVKDMSRALATLEPGQRAAYLGRVPEDLRDATLATLYFRAALTLPKDNRESFIQEVCPEGKPRELALFLASNNPEAHIDDSGQLLRMTALGPAETFTLTLKLAFFAGIILSFPLLLWFLAEFVLPGLTREERRMVLPSVLIGFVLFTIGICFAYFVVAPKALRFFYEYSLRLGVISDWRIGYFVSFVTQFTLIFGLCFELPVVVMALVKLGILSYGSMSRTRSHAIVTIFVVAAIITPTTDALTLFLLAGPMLLLYEICIWLAWMIERKERRRAEEEEKEWQDRMLVPAVAATAGNAAAQSADVSGDPAGSDHTDDDSDLPRLSPAPGAVAMDDIDELPPDWGSTRDPYAPNDEEWQDPYGPTADDPSIPEPPPGPDYPPTDTGSPETSGGNTPHQASPTTTMPEENGASPGPRQPIDG